MTKKLICECGSKEFVVSATEYHDWVVDEHGEFVRDIECYEAKVTGEIFTCNKCSKTVEKE